MRTRTSVATTPAAAVWSYIGAASAASFEPGPLKRESIGGAKAHSAKPASRQHGATRSRAAQSRRDSPQRGVAS